MFTLDYITLPMEYYNKYFCIGLKDAFAASAEEISTRIEDNAALAERIKNAKISPDLDEGVMKDIFNSTSDSIHKGYEAGLNKGNKIIHHKVCPLTAL